MELCPRCEKKLSLCVCATIRPLPNRTPVLILQHPQEPDKDLGTAKLAQLCLLNSQLKIGLSWRNLSAALGREAAASRWIVLHLGSGFKGSTDTHPKKPGLYLVSKKGEPLPTSSANLTTDGLILLDGTWSQAKTLWWRNAWLLKARRGILIPSRPSMYGFLRKEPRKECLSTLETIADCLDSLQESPEISEQLRSVFGMLLQKRKGPPQSRQSSQN